ncbi:MAG: hypothetical protein ACREMI_08650 [Gemmatimonadales bacterium]
MRIRPLSHSSFVRTLVTLVTSACIGGTGSGLVGISVGGDDGGTGTGAAPVLSFFSPPNTANVGQTMSTVQIVATDSLGSVAATFEGAVTVSLASNSTGAGLSGTTTVRASDGVATFTNLSVDRAGTYTLRASASGAAAVTSDPFTITTAATP